MAESMSCRLAGVTFENRQNILRDLYLKRGIVHKMRLENTTFDGEPAIKVFEERTNQQVGWIPKDEVAKFYNTGITVVKGIVDAYKNTWYCKITTE